MHAHAENVDHGVPPRIVLRLRMDFKDDGGTPMWRRRQTEALYARKRRLTFVQKLSLIVFAGLILPYLLLLGGPAFGALWNWAMPAAHASNTEPMALKDFLTDQAALKGRSVTVVGVPLCAGSLCFLYEDMSNPMQSLAFDPAHVDRDSRRRLLDCNPYTNPCHIEITGRAGGIPLPITSLRFLAP